MMVKLCYDASELGSKPWRKKKDIVNKNKRCKQTVVEADYLKAGYHGRRRLVTSTSRSR